jgi:hypothetical protein
MYNLWVIKLWYSLGPEAALCEVHLVRVYCLSQLLPPAVWPDSSSLRTLTCAQFSCSREANPLNTELRLNDIYKCSSYLTGNTLRLRYRDQPVNAV